MNDCFYKDNFALSVLAPAVLGKNMSVDMRVDVPGGNPASNVVMTVTTRHMM